MRLSKDSKLSYNEQFITADGRPWFPVMGEMHFSRYPRQHWEEELYKMKAGGLDIVSLYTIWIHHEEIEGEFDFTGDRDLRAFLNEIQKTGLYCILRIGPWAHGEARNGGFPDWLLAKEKEEGFRTRTDDEGYLKYARRFYEKIFEQAKGLFLKDGGPIIGIQIENEYGHVGGQTGEAGEQHMRTLQNLAKEIGFDVPLWTATGWGGAVTGGMIPVMGGYCEAPWDQRLEEIEPSGNYVFTKERNDHNIGSDHGLGFGITFDMDKFPYLTAELGGGLQVTDHRRPIATGPDVGAMSMAKMGSGCNLLGYYMYHGGTNPQGRKTTLMESRETGYPNDLPVLSYDFNAPLKEYGQITDNFREIKILAMFAHDFDQEFCQMPYIPQEGNPIDPSDLKSLRTAVRSHEILYNGEKIQSGFLFVNNYQRHYVMADHEEVKLKAMDADGKLIAEFPKKVTILDEDFFFYPFNMKIGEKALIKSAYATPLCILHGAADGKDAYVFYRNGSAEASFDIEGDLDGNKILLISREDALCAEKLEKDGKEYLAFSEDSIVPGKDGYDLLMSVGDEGEDEERARFWIWPDLPAAPARFHKAEDPFMEDAEIAADEAILGNEVFNEYIYDFVLSNPVTYEVKAKNGISDPGDRSMEAEEVQDPARTCYYLHLENIAPELDELYLQIHYSGNHAGMFHGGRMIADSFYTCQEWEIGVKRFLEEDMAKEGESAARDSFTAEIAITPLAEDAPKYLEYWPPMNELEDFACRIDEVYTVAQYRDRIF